MKQTKRIRLLCGQLAACETFADVGCDHGYCTQYMLEENLCRRAVVSDISAGSLSKAEKLLSAYIAAGRVARTCAAAPSSPISARAAFPRRKSCFQPT